MLTGFDGYLHSTLTEYLKWYHRSNDADGDRDRGVIIMVRFRRVVKIQSKRTDGIFRRHTYLANPTNAGKNELAKFLL